LNHKDTYRILERESEGFYKEKGSKFYSFAYPVESEDRVKEILTGLKKEYYDARHHCYAYILGLHGENHRVNDDGEPGHSAGDPILGQIRSRQLTNTLVVVVRYFGGTKLGVSGLINAYKTAASESIDNNSVLERQILSEIFIRFDYPLMNQVMRIIKEFELTIIEQSLEMSCEMVLGVRLSKSTLVMQELQRFHEIQIVNSEE
jgi:uncharacterized YigZ family protein